MVTERLLREIPGGEYRQLGSTCNGQATAVVILMSPQQVTRREIIDDAQRLRKQSRELRHRSCNIRAVSILWMEMSQDLVTTVLGHRSQRVMDDTKDGDTQMKL